MLDQPGKPLSVRVSDLSGRKQWRRVMPSVVLKTITHHVADVTDPRANQGLHDPLIGMFFLAFFGTAVIDASPLFFAKPYNVFPFGFVRSDHIIACARVQGMFRKLTESQGTSHSVFSVPDSLPSRGRRFQSCHPDYISDFRNKAQFFLDFQVQYSPLQRGGHQSDLP